MNRLTKSLFDVSDGDAFIGINARHTENIDKLFYRMDSGRDEQAAYFPFNLENPIWKKLNLIPSVRFMFFSAPRNSVNIDGCLLNDRGEKCMDLGLELGVNKAGRLEIEMRHVWNDNVSEENKGKRIGAYYVNALQNFMVYSKNPDRIILETREDGSHYWSQWFDFEKMQHMQSDIVELKDFLPEYKKQFEEVVMTARILIRHKLRRSDVKNAIADFRYPIQFRTVNMLVGGGDEIGKIGMKYSQDWHGKCSLYELLPTNPIRSMGLGMMAERKIQTEYPADFSRMVMKQIQLATARAK